MTALVYYLLKVILCSGVLYLYYALALKNKLFHQWNRFYLLAAVALSLVLPLVKLTVFTAAPEKQNAIKLLYVVQSADDYLEAITVSSTSTSLSPEQWLWVAYGSVSLLLLLLFVFALWRIRRLLKSHIVQSVANVCFINTREPGTPFSFLKYIFWNEDIPLHSETGQQIFQHEAVHVKEGHTWDKLFLQAVLTAFWSNPFFWVIRHELRFIHEFIADRKAINGNGTASFAAMILQAAYPKQFRAIVNPFFQKSIKRRLTMLTKIQHPRRAYISRLVTLPLVAIVAFAFTVRTRNTAANGVKLNKEFVVVIDAGHGKKDGRYTGAKDGALYEDEVVLSVAKKIGELNTDANLKVVFTRSDENNVDLKQRIALAQEAKADLFLSIHLNAVPDAIKAEQQPLRRNELDGFQIFIPANNALFEPQSKLLGSSLLSEMSPFYKTNPVLLKPETGTYVLNAAPCAAVLLECGTINNKADREFITSQANQGKLALRILAAIHQFAALKAKDANVSVDTLPKKQIESVDVNSAKKILTVYYTDGTCETMTEKEANDRRLINSGGYANVQKLPLQKDVQKSELRLKDSTGKPLIVVDGNTVAYRLLSALDPNKIESINILKGDTATAKYGNKGSNGVIEIKTKAVGGGTIRFKTDEATGTVDSLRIISVEPINLRANIRVDDAASKNNDPVFVQTEIPASIDKGEWRAFLSKNLQPIIEQTVKKGAKPGTYIINIRFLVKKDGSLADFQALNKPGYDLEKQLLAIMPNSPKWKPAEQNGRPVTSYHTQPVTLMIQEQ